LASNTAAIIAHGVARRFAAQQCLCGCARLGQQWPARIQAFATSIQAFATSASAHVHALADSCLHVHKPLPPVHLRMCTPWPTVASTRVQDSIGTMCLLLTASLALFRAEERQLALAAAHLSWLFASEARSGAELRRLLVRLCSCCFCIHCLFWTWLECAEWFELACGVVGPRTHELTCKIHPRVS
jgi:hypothetical protein